MRRYIIAAVAVALASTTMLAAPGSSAAKKTDWFVDESKLPFDALPGATALWGVRSGAGYQMEVPDDWNGHLVVHAHGFRGTGLELTVDMPPIRQHLIDQGFAWAASSYSKNGYVPGQGAKDSKALVNEFTGRVGNPDEVYIMGFSMGGHVTGVAIEQWPNTFDGALPMCGVMGDSELFDYFLDTYLLAEYSVGNVPAVPTPDDYFSSGAHQLTFFQLGFFGPTLTPAGEHYKAAVEQLTGGERPTYDEGFAQIFGVGAFFPFAFEVAGTADGRGNVDTVYQLDGDPALNPQEAALNAEIPRVASAPQFRRPNGLGGLPGVEDDSPKVNGTFTIPVISLHTLGELFVPFHMQQIYAERAAANGNADLLATRAIRDISHCGFAGPEIVEAFDDLVTWVQDGVPAAGDAILDPVAMADPDFGCAFTLFDRPGLAPCP